MFRRHRRLSARRWRPRHGSPSPASATGRGPAAGKICIAVLLGVAPLALVIPGGDVGYGQSPPGSQVPLFTAIDLNPSGVDFSVAHGIFGEQQVGESNPTSVGDNHALLWRGSAASVVDLHPSGFERSEAHGTSGGQQVGYGSGPVTGGDDHALLWRGSAATVVDLHPSGFEISEAFGTSGGQQVGVGDGHALLWRGSAASVVDLRPSGFEISEAFGTSGGQQVGWGYRPGAEGTHALLWRGSAASVVDLHVFLPPDFVSSSASDIDATGDIVGRAWGKDVGAGTPAYNLMHAFLWKRNVPKPGTSREQDTMQYP